MNFSKEKRNDMARSDRPKGKKSVALSRVVAGDTAICSVGQDEHELLYRGYDIRDLATQATFEEIAWLLVHGSLPEADELHSYRRKLCSLRGLPQRVKTVLEQIPSTTHPMDVLRTGCSMLGTALPEAGDFTAAVTGTSPTAYWPAWVRFSFIGTNSPTSAVLWMWKRTLIPFPGISWNCCMDANPLPCSPAPSINR